MAASYEKKPFRSILNVLRHFELGNQQCSWDTRTNASLYPAHRAKASNGRLASLMATSYEKTFRGILNVSILGHRPAWLSPAITCLASYRYISKLTPARPGPRSLLTLKRLDYDVNDARPAAGNSKLFDLLSLQAHPIQSFELFSKNHNLVDC